MGLVNLELPLPPGQSWEKTLVGLKHVSKAVWTEAHMKVKFALMLAPVVALCAMGLIGAANELQLTQASAARNHPSHE